MARMSKTSGFTLIELAIVLVIIGLITGGIFFGRDMITAANVRGQLAQIEKTDTALMTFRSKYGALPGDITPDNADSYGFTSRSGEEGHGDGDGRISRCDYSSIFRSAGPFLGCENILVWSDLSKANLISGSFTSATDTDLTSVASKDLGLYFPRPFISPTAIFHIGQNEDTMDNWYVFIKIADIDGTGGFGSGSPDNLWAPQAYAIDSKIDDGNALTGRVRVTGISYIPAGYFFGAPAQFQTRCVYLNAYNLSNNTGAPCSLVVKVKGIN